MSRFRRLVHEIHRRSLWQVLGIYVAGSWVALEVAGELTESFGLPSWFPALALGLLIVGLPVVLATAFIQEGDGAKPASAAPATAAAPADHAQRDPAEAPAASTRTARLFTWRNAIVGGVAAFALWGMIAAGFLIAGGAPSAAAEEERAQASLAVLPFQNLSGDDENRYFADGIHEEILTRLAGLGGLKVISRTSVMEYRDAQRNLREVATELGVDHVLEGSVRRSGDQVRVTAQLIDARTDAHLWARSYDRGLSDIFAIQADVAEQIARALHAELNPQERERLTRRPTDDVAAYEDYLRANELLASGQEPEWIGQARALYERALARDSMFTDARARLAWSHLLTYWLGHDRSPSRVEAARTHIEALRRIAPDAPSTHYAVGYLRYYGEYDFAGAAREFEQALDGVPEARQALAYAQRRMGLWQEHLANMNAARELSPRDQGLARNQAQTLTVLRRFDEASALYRLAVDLTPAATDAWGQLVASYQVAGRPAEARAALDAALAQGVAALERERVWLALSQRDLPAALAAVDAIEEPIVTDQFTYEPVPLLRAEVLLASGQPARARQEFEAAHRALETATAERPWDPRVWIALARARAGLGRRDAAHDAMTRARELYPVDRDRMGGPEVLEQFAEVHARLGEHDAAIAILRDLLARPSMVTVHTLRTEPRWDPLRSDPRFAGLLRG